MPSSSATVNRQGMRPISSRELKIIRSTPKANGNRKPSRRGSPALNPPWLSHPRFHALRNLLRELRRLPASNSKLIAASYRRILETSKASLVELRSLRSGALQCKPPIRKCLEENQQRIGTRKLLEQSPELNELFRPAVGRRS